MFETRTSSKIDSPILNWTIWKQIYPLSEFKVNDFKVTFVRTLAESIDFKAIVHLLALPFGYQNWTSFWLKWHQCPFHYINVWMAKNEQNEFEPNNNVLISKLMQMCAPKPAQVFFLFLFELLHKCTSNKLINCPHFKVLV